MPIFFSRHGVQVRGHPIQTPCLIPFISFQHLHVIMLLCLLNNLSTYCLVCGSCHPMHFYLHMHLLQHHIGVLQQQKVFNPFFFLIFLFLLKLFGPFFMPFRLHYSPCVSAPFFTTWGLCKMILWDNQEPEWYLKTTLVTMVVTLSF